MVRNLTLSKSEGILGAFPDTIMTAIASPMARPTPSTTAAVIPLFAAGTDTRKYVSMGAPSDSDAYSYSLGTASRALRETFIMDGSTIIASTMMAARSPDPSATPKILLMAGTSTSIPTRP